MRDFIFRFFLFCWLALFGVGLLSASYVSGDPDPYPDAKAELKGLAYIPPPQETFGYDADGNRISSALWDYNWDGRNRLVGARSKDYLTAPKGFDLTFNYDAEGRRFQKNVTEYKNGSITATRNTIFVWDGWDLLYERCEDASGALLLERKYVWGESPVGAATGNLLCIRETKNGVTSELLPLYDGSGHLTALTDSSKNLLAEYAYGPFGELIHAKGPRAEANPWRYATKYFDEETGLYYFGHRYYDPNSGQWMNRELLGENESLNLYAYCHNDPVNKVDVLGLAEKGVEKLSVWEMIFPSLMAPQTPDPERAAILQQASSFRNEVTYPLLRMPASLARVPARALQNAAIDKGGDLIANGDSVGGYTLATIGGIVGQTLETPGAFMDPITYDAVHQTGNDYFIQGTKNAFNSAGGGIRGTWYATNHAGFGWNVGKGYEGYLTGDVEMMMAGIGATGDTALFFLGPQAAALKAARYSKLETGAPLASWENVIDGQLVKLESWGLPIRSYVVDPLVSRNTADFMRSRGQLGGRLFPESKIPSLVSYLEKRGIHVYEGINGSFDGVNGMMQLPRNPTVLNVRHELSHYLDWKKFGDDYYRVFTPLQREQMVLDRLKNNRVWNELNFKEWSWSIEYPASR